MLRAARFIGFIATVLLIWVSLRPFPDLGDPGMGDADKGKLATTYIALGVFSVFAFALTAHRHAKALRSLLTPAFLLLCGWICINTIFSHDFGLSAQRLILTCSVMALAACLLLLPDSQDELDNWLSVSALIFLALCYLGVVLAPSVSIHTARDTLEPQLAGDWRGPFGHKNVAAPIMAVLVFAGIYLIARRSLLSGIAIVVLSGIFLSMTAGKSAMALFIFALVLSIPVAATRRLALRACLIFLPLLCLNLLTVGSVLNERLSALTKLLPLDTSFTGRTNIWDFAISSLKLRPWLGYGFAAFWGTNSIQGLVQDSQIEWAASAAHSHNGPRQRPYDGDSRSCLDHGDFRDRAAAKFLGCDRTRTSRTARKTLSSDMAVRDISFFDGEFSARPRRYDLVHLPGRRLRTALHRTLPSGIGAPRRRGFRALRLELL